ncbi:MAG: TetR family transcriptional regulator [Alphaproteobacteria bacterium]|nr:TetR family transcriptional regulator [Alphaproteobacteria bacterium]MDE2163019.1 TetR family transcriptional regulator [Alphaproteobacteria bacterium]MDE2264785.1 TetR family transcriptional regulator [Alphaproteobacteria bacterium]MDE2499113.1 TetR family transcriptional regulator [Alphaproteobacteria bacterium]
MKKPSSARRTKRRNNPDATKQDILNTATEEFANYGLSGARVDRIAKKMRTSKRMIYYYFGSKEALYRTVLEQAYAGIRTSEAETRLDSASPTEALRQLIEVTFDYEEAHPDFINLVSIENLHHARYLAKAASIRSLNIVIIKRLEDILARGRAEGVFRSDIDALDVHMMISALCFFRVANRHTFNVLFSRDLSSPRVRTHHKRMISEAVLRLLAP